ITRLIRTYLDSGSVQERLYHRHQFARHYTDADIALLAEVDRAHERLNGAATRRAAGAAAAPPPRAPPRPRHYTDADIALLAEVDRAHERLNGAATRRI